MTPASSSKMRRLTTLCTSQSRSSVESPSVTPTKTSAPGPIAPVTLPSTATLASRTRWTRARIRLFDDFPLDLDEAAVLESQRRERTGVFGNRQVCPARGLAAVATTFHIGGTDAGHDFALVNAGRQKFPLRGIARRRRRLGSRAAFGLGRRLRHRKRLTRRRSGSGAERQHRNRRRVLVEVAQFLARSARLILVDGRTAVALAFVDRREGRYCCSGEGLRDDGNHPCTCSMQPVRLRIHRGVTIALLQPNAPYDFR